jgi:hypothetical protein
MMDTVTYINQGTAFKRYLHWGTDDTARTKKRITRLMNSEQTGDMDFSRDNITVAYGAYSRYKYKARHNHE